MRYPALRLSLLLLMAAPTLPALAAPPDRAAIEIAVQTIVDDYLAANSETEGMTAVSASVSLPGGGPTIDAVAGVMSRAPDAAKLTSDALFPFGSITKSMTSTVVLQLVAEGVLSLDAPIGRWLPEYPAWKDVTLRRLLNMTSGIPSHDGTLAFRTAVAKGGVGRHFSKEVLLSFADPDLPGAPAPTTGFDYSNLNYIIAQMVVERATGRSLDDQIRERILSRGHGLDATFYQSGPYPDSVMSRTVSSYMMTPPDPVLEPLVGVDLKHQDPSWIQGAGAGIATVSDVTRWVRILFQGDILAPAEKSALMAQVSVASGKPIDGPTPEDSSTFALGVSQTLIGGVPFWYYEGGLMGSRVFYGYFPERDLVVAIGVNSGSVEKDNLGLAAIALYEAATGETIALSKPKASETR